MIVVFGVIVVAVAVLIWWVRVRNRVMGYGFFLNCMLLLYFSINFYSCTRIIWMDLLTFAKLTSTLVLGFYGWIFC